MESNYEYGFDIFYYCVAVITAFIGHSLSHIESGMQVKVQLKLIRLRAKPEHKKIKLVCDII